MTEIHAAVPGNIAAEVKEAQMRGEDVPLEAGPATTEKKAPAQGKGKERVKTTPRTSKVHRIATEDEENMRREDTTQEPGSDPEEDWIPGPNATTKPTATRNNIFGIKGLDNGMQSGQTPKRIFLTDHPPPSESDDKENHDTSDTFITVPSKRTPQHTANQPLDLRLPHAQPFASTQDNPEFLKFSQSNPFSAIQPNNQTCPLFQEFSYSWEDAALLHGTSLVNGDDVGAAGSGENKSSVRKRLAGEEFEKKKEWEMKRFKRAGWDLGRYNRGDFGTRMGIGRL